METVSPTELSSASKHTAHGTHTHRTSHYGTHIPALTYIIHSYICSHNDNRVLKLKKKTGSGKNIAQQTPSSKRASQSSCRGTTRSSCPSHSLTFTLRSAGTFRVVPGCHLGGFLAVVIRLCLCVPPYRGFVLLSQLCLSSVPGCKPVGFLFACSCCREGPLSGWPVTIQ